MLLQECTQYITATDVLSVCRAGLELDTWPIQDGCGIGTRSSAQMFHSRHLLLWIHNIYWYKKLTEECHPSPPACPPQPLLSLPSKVWAVTGSRKNLGRGWEHGLCSVLSWTACLAGLRGQHVPWTQERTAQYWGRAIITLVLLRVCRKVFTVSLTRSCNILPRHIFTSASLLLFSPISKSFWGQVRQFKKNTNTVDNWHLKLNSCAKVAQ